MSWTAGERKTINELCVAVREIKAAIVGDLKSDKPGLQDRVRDLEKRHKYLFLLSGAALVGFVWFAANGSVESLVKLIVRAL